MKKHLGRAFLLLAIVAIPAAALLAGCSGAPDCKGACDVATSCGLKTSGLSCDSTCDQGSCAACVNSTSCADIEKGACAADCPGVSFTKK